MTGRRSFLSFAVGMLSIPAQRAIIEKGKAVICESDSLICPVCKEKTCPKIDAPIVVGSGSYQNPDVQALNDFHVIRCDNCHALFTRE